MKNTKNNELAVCGFAAVKTLEKVNGGRIKRLYFTRERAPLFGGLCKKLAASKRPYNQVADPAELEKLCGSVHHQGVVAMVEPPEILPLTTGVTAGWVQTRQHAVLLDHVGNANNFGAIVRSAAFFGIRNIILPLDEAQTSITTSTYRVAEGGMEFVTVYSVKSIPRLLEDVRGRMAIVGSSLDGRESSRTLGALAAGGPVLLVLGNEENGISRSTRSYCDHLVIIPFAGMGASGGEPAIDSLNVAQASAVLFYELAGGAQ